MAQWVTVWRAAQLVGVPRGVLQQRVRRGELLLNDGLVATEALLRLYPQTQIESGGLLERVAQIREEAFGRRVRERVLPSQELLAQRLFSQGQELADVQRHLQRYHALVLDLRDQLRSLRATAEDGRLAELEQQLSDGLARVLATEPVDLLNVMDDVLKVMSAQVTLRPSGHQFVVEGHDSLLQAGLRAGLKLNYGCGNGSCGMCKLRVTAGEVARTMVSDYPMSEAERAQGYVLACAHTAASSELTVETLEADGPADIPAQQIVAALRSIKPAGADTLLLHLQTPRTHRLRFLAGQSVTLGLAGAGAGGEDLHASYPVASCPCDDRNLHFQIARDAGDALAEHLFHGHVRAGASVTVWGPQGDFVLDDEGSRPLVFAACDTGFGPLKSLIEHAMSLDAAPSMALFWLATRPDGHYMSNLCRSWSEALDGFEATLSEQHDAVEGARQIAAAMRADLFDVDCDFYLAGPPDFVDTLLRALQQAGVPQRQLRGLAL